MSQHTSPSLVANGAQHALQNSWTLWYDGKKNHQNPSAVAAAEWADTLMEVKSFSTVEDFWALYSFLKKPSVLEVGPSYNFFKKGVKPAWEDPQCAKGGKWVIPLQGDELAQVDKLWELTLLSLIGERLEEGSSIVGAVLNKRRNVNIAIWVNNCQDSGAVLGVGNAIRKELGLDPKRPITFVTLESVPKVLHTIPASAN